MRILSYTSHHTGGQRRLGCWWRWLAAAICALSAFPIYAQPDNAPDPAIRIMAVDTTNFPDVTIHLYGENLPADLATLPITVTEDGIDITVNADNTAAGVVGTQTAIVFDASGSITQNGPTNQPVYIEVGETLRRLQDLRILSSDRDFLTAISFGADQQPTVLRGWSQDHQAVVDSVYLYRPVEGIGDTPIDGILRFTLDTFKDASLPAGQVQSIVLFSDGIDVIEREALFEAQDFAAEAHIPIHTVLIGQENAASRSKMEGLARLTGGKFVYLSSLEALDSFWPMIAQAGTRRILTYRSQQAKPILVEVAATLPDRPEPVRETSLIKPPVPLPAKITIVRPTAGSIIERREPESGAPITEFDQKQIVVQAVVEFPDSRTIRSIKYEVAGRSSKSLTENFDQPYVFDISSLGAGEYNFRASMVDELGIEVTSELLSFRIEEIRLPTPTATPDVVATETAIAAVQTRQAADATATQVAQKLTITTVTSNRLLLATIVATVFGLAMLGVAIYVLSNRERRKAATQMITGTVAAVTQPFIRRGGRRGGEQPRAQFRLLESGGVDDALQTIPLTRSGITIGRDPTVANIVFSDRHVSKLHCRVVEDAGSAGYRLLDEGSTSGTYVNEREVDINGQVLRHGDIIAIGPLQYQFEMPEAGRRPVSEPKDGTTAHDTEPFLKVSKAKTEPYKPAKDR